MDGRDLGGGEHLEGFVGVSASEGEMGQLVVVREEREERYRRIVMLP